jgi:hypothetical protein
VAKRDGSHVKRRPVWRRPNVIRVHPLRRLTLTAVHARMLMFMLSPLLR